MVGTDYLDYAKDDGIDHEWNRIVMNPPFTKQQDIDHILAAYDILAPGGILVSVVSEAPFFWSNKKALAFRGFLDSHGAEMVKLDEGAFKESGTMVRTRIIKLEKPRAE